MTRRERREGTPGSYIGCGLAVAAITGVLGGAMNFDGPGIAVTVIGGLLAQVLLAIGVIAKGVQIGTSRVD